MLCYLENIAFELVTAGVCSGLTWMSSVYVNTNKIMVKAFNIESQMIYFIFAVFFVRFGYSIAYLLSSIKLQTQTSSDLSKQATVSWKQWQKPILSSHHTRKYQREEVVAVGALSQCGMKCLAAVSMVLFWASMAAAGLLHVSHAEEETQGDNVTVWAVLSLKPIALVVPHE